MSTKKKTSKETTTTQETPVNGLTTTQETQINKLANFNTIDEVLGYSKHLIKTGVLPRGYKNPETVMLAIQMGKELGFGPVQSLYGIDIIDGKPSLSAKLISAVVWNNGCAYKTLKSAEPVYGDIYDEEGNLTMTAEENTKQKHQMTDQETVIRFFRPFHGTLIEEDVKFTWSEANERGLLEKQNWQKMYEVMAWNRCVTKGARRIVPDSMCSMYSSAEVADFSDVEYVVDEDGDLTILDDNNK